MCAGSGAAEYRSDLPAFIRGERDSFPTRPVRNAAGCSRGASCSFSLRASARRSFFCRRHAASGLHIPVPRGGQLPHHPAADGAGIRLHPVGDRGAPMPRLERRARRLPGAEGLRGEIRPASSPFSVPLIE